MHSLIPSALLARASRHARSLTAQFLPLRRSSIRRFHLRRRLTSSLETTADLRLALGRWVLDLLIVRSAEPSHWRQHRDYSRALGSVFISFPVCLTSSVRLLLVVHELCDFRPTVVAVDLSIVGMASPELDQEGRDCPSQCPLSHSRVFSFDEKIENEQFVVFGPFFPASNPLLYA